MSYKAKHPSPTQYEILTPLRTFCDACGKRLWIAYHNQRVITTLDGVCHLTLSIRRCQNGNCIRYHHPCRPEEEGGWALPHGTFGLDIIALVGTLRYTLHRSIPEIHQDLCHRGVLIAERTVTNLLARYEELVALRLMDHAQVRERLSSQGRIILALDALQPDVGHETQRYQFLIALEQVRDCPFSDTDSLDHRGPDGFQGHSCWRYSARNQPERSRPDQTRRVVRPTCPPPLADTDNDTVGTADCDNGGHRA